MPKKPADFAATTIALRPDLLVVALIQGLHLSALIACMMLLPQWPWLAILYPCVVFSGYREWSRYRRTHNGTGLLVSEEQCFYRQGHQLTRLHITQLTRWPGIVLMRATDSSRGEALSFYLLRRQYSPMQWARALGSLQRSQYRGV